MDPVIAAGLIQAGASVANSSGDFLSNAIFGRRNERWARQDATTAFNRQQQLLAEQRAYESPASQMQRFIDAGLHPGLIYGQQQGSIAPPSVPQAASANVAPPSMSLDVSGLLNAKVAQAQIRNLNEQADLSKAEAWRVYKIGEVQYDNIKVDSARLQQLITQQEFVTKVERFKSDLFDDVGYGESGRSFANEFRELIANSAIDKLKSDQTEYLKAIELFETEIGIRKAQERKIELENQDLEKFVDVCARIYEGQASQADYLAAVSELNQDFYGRLGASNDVVKLIYGFLSLFVQAIKSTPFSSPGRSK